MKFNTEVRKTQNFISNPTKSTVTMYTYHTKIRMKQQFINPTKITNI